MGKNFYTSGQFNLVCDRCSKKIKAQEAKHEWTGLIVCGDCWEPRHEQDFVRAKQDKITVPFSRPIPELVFTNVNFCTLWTIQGVADQGTADCSQADLDIDLNWNDWIQTYCSIEAQSGITQNAIAGCAIAGKYSNGHL